MYSNFIRAMKPKMNALAVATIFSAGLPGVLAQDETPEGKEAEKRVDTTVVIGEADDILDVPGSGAVLTSEDLARQSYDDANQALRKVPGVYLRPEDGYGFFPNISLRGVDTTRSAKVTLMEDGVLTAPAAYSAPSAYYSPTLGRMSAIEVLMGSSQTRYGPHTTGGVINYRSTEIPESGKAYIKTLYGSNNEQRTHAYAGDTFDTESGRVGILLEGYLRNSDGFKHIDTTADFQDGNDTGFSKTEPMLKLSWEPNTDRYSRFELKLGYTDFQANEGYTGLTEADYAADPYRRYAGSRFDQMNSEHSRSYLRHFYELSNETMVTTTAYYNRFHRDWFKLNDVRDDTGAKKSLSQILAGGGTHLDVLRGTAPGTLAVKHNNRNYRSYGVDSAVSHDHNFLGRENQANIGIRYHFDNVRRFQTQELFTQDLTGAIIDRDPGTPGHAGNRDQTSKALAIYAENEIAVNDKLSVIPGIRWETVDQHFWDKKEDDPATNGDGSLNLLAGGIGVTYDYTDEVSFFGGIHQGYSVPGPRSAIRGNLKEETSLGLEVGPRYREKTGLWAADATLFLTNFNDLLVIDNIGGTGTGDTENVGEVRATGIELSVEADGKRLFNTPFNNPWYAAVTITDATLSNDSNSEDAESIFANGVKGNKVPYIPDLAFNIGTGFERGKFGFYINGAYMDEMFTSASNTTDLVDGAGTPDSRFGKTESYFLLDISARYRATDEVTLFAGVQNVLDDDYLVTRHPHGARSGQPIFAYIGMEIGLGSE